MGCLSLLPASIRGVLHCLGEPWAMAILQRDWNFLNRISRRRPFQMVGQIRQPHFPQGQNALMQPSHWLIVAVQAIAAKHLFDPDIQSFQCVQPRLNNFILWVSHSFFPFSSKPDKFRFIYPDYTSFLYASTSVCLQCVGISPLYFPGSGLPVRGRAPR